MRLRRSIAVVAGLVLGACYADYDPCDTIAYREFPDAKSALTTILDEVGPAKVYAVGEYHPSRATSGTARTPLSRFTHEIMDVLVPRSRHLVIETWIDPDCGDASGLVRREIQDATGRPAGTGLDIEALKMRGRKDKLQVHALPMTCFEHAGLLDPTGRVDFLRLLELVTEKLGTAARALVSDERAVIVYGGALHNDLYPRWPLEDLSYAASLQKELGGGVVELDLVVPEVVAPMAMVRLEDWFPLLSRASPERVIVWERGPSSYVIILPAANLLTANVAKPRPDHLN
jgi:hypothetical protein